MSLLCCSSGTSEQLVEDSFHSNQLDTKSNRAMATAASPTALPQTSANGQENTVNPANEALQSGDVQPADQHEAIIVDPVFPATNRDSRKSSVAESVRSSASKQSYSEKGNPPDFQEQYDALKKDLIRQKLVHETKLKQKDRLERAIKDYNDAGVGSEDSDEMKAALKELNILKIKEDLQKATLDRDIGRINELMEQIKTQEKEGKDEVIKQQKKYLPGQASKEPFVTNIPAETRKQDQPKSSTIQPLYPTSPRVERKRQIPRYMMPREPAVDGRVEAQVKYEIGEARKMKKQVKEEQKKAKDPRNMDLYKTLTEIKYYPNPPAGLHELMAAILLLMGEDEKKTEHWSVCARMCNPIGPKGMTNRIYSFDLQHVHPDIAARANEIFSAVDYKKLSKTTHGGATLFVWLSGALKEYEDQYGFGTPAKIKEQREIFWRNPPPFSTYSTYNPRP